jgi:hypothetical protein
LACAARCLDKYFELRVKQVEHKEDVEVDSRLTSIVERMLDRWGWRAQIDLVRDLRGLL